MDVSYTFVCIDCILVSSESREQYYIDLKKNLPILPENDVQISVNKCQSYNDTIDFLGFNISTEDLKPITQKVQHIKYFSETTDSKSLCRFLGMINFYRKLILLAADMLLTIIEAIKHNPAPKILKLSPAENKTFVTKKDILAKVSALTHPDPGVTQ